MLLFDGRTESGAGSVQIIMDPGSQQLTNPELEHRKIPSYAAVFLTLFVDVKPFLRCLFLIKYLSFSIGLKRHACIKAVRPKGLHSGSLENKKTPAADKEKEASLLMPAEISEVPPCHLCGNRFPHLRRLKEHYINVHYREAFREKYTGGKPISYTVEGDCQLCPYVGKTKELVLHVGIAHGKLKEFLPDEVWYQLFGHQVRKFKPPTVSHKATTKRVKSSHPTANGKGGRLSAKPLSTNEQLVLKSGKAAAASKADGGQLLSCQLCEYSASKNDVKMHYLSHYREEMYVKYFPKHKARPLSRKCDSCSFKGRHAGDLLRHMWSAHGGAKEFLPKAVWDQVRPVLRTKNSKKKKPLMGNNSKFEQREHVSKKKDEQSAAEKVKMEEEQQKTEDEQQKSDDEQQKKREGKHQREDEQQKMENYQQKGEVEQKMEEKQQRRKDEKHDREDEQQQREDEQQQREDEQQQREDEQQQREDEQQQREDKQQEQVDEEQEYDPFYNDLEYKEEDMDFEEMDLNNQFDSEQNPGLPDCPLCSLGFGSRDKLLRHLILVHFAERMCQDYEIDTDDLLGDGYSCVLCGSSENLPLEEHLVHMGIRHGEYKTILDVVIELWNGVHLYKAVL